MQDGAHRCLVHAVAPEQFQRDIASPSVDPIGSAPAVACDSKQGLETGWQAETMGSSQATSIRLISNVKASLEIAPGMGTKD